MKVWEKINALLKEDLTLEERCNSFKAAGLCPVGVAQNHFKDITLMTIARCGMRCGNPTVEANCTKHIEEFLSSHYDEEKKINNLMQELLDDGSFGEMKLQDFIELVQLCEINGITTLDEFKQYKAVCARRYKNITNLDLLAELTKTATIKD